MLMMEVDPERGIAFQMEDVSEKNRGRVIDYIVSSWSPYDVVGAGKWLSQQSQGPELDKARGTYAGNVAYRDPVAAMDWAKSITAPEQRAASVAQVYNTWKKKDSAAAEAALKASGLSDEQIQKARAAGKPNQL
jgi:hypothetical protein